MHWKAELAKAEADAWLELNRGWDKGLPAEPRGVKVLTTQQVRAAEAELAEKRAKGELPEVNDYQGAGQPWWRTVAREQRVAADYRTAPATAQQLAHRAGQEAHYPAATLVRGRLFLAPPASAGVAMDRTRARVMAMPRHQRLADTTWVLGHEPKRRLKTAADRLRAQQLTVTGQHHWLQTLGAMANYKLQCVRLDAPVAAPAGTSDGVNDDPTTALDQAELMTADAGTALSALAAAELAAWVELNLTTAERTALLADAGQRSSPSADTARRRARRKLANLPAGLRGLRR
jgi:hypothetical protein